MHDKKAKIERDSDMKRLREARKEEEEEKEDNKKEEAGEK